MLITSQAFRLFLSFYFLFFSPLSLIPRVSAWSREAFNGKLISQILPVQKFLPGPGPCLEHQGIHEMEGKQLFTECFPEGFEEVMTLNGGLLESLEVTCHRENGLTHYILKICLFLAKKEANQQRGAGFWDANQEVSFSLYFFFFSSNSIFSLSVSETRAT